MTWDEYWNGPVWLTSDFIKAEKLRQESKDREAWLQGLYIYEAIGDMTPVLHAFAKNGAKPMPYPKKPFFSSGQETKEKQRIDLEEKNRLIAKLHMNNLIRQSRRNNR